MSRSETAVQADVRLTLARKGYTLFRNNVGTLLDKRGVPLRFGLANDSAALNARYKSADLIGWRTVTVTPDMVGQQLAVFVSRECKEEGWIPAPPTNRTRYEHEQAQRNWADLVTAAGGDATFVTGAG